MTSVLFYENGSWISPSLEDCSVPLSQRGEISRPQKAEVMRCTLLTFLDLISPESEQLFTTEFLAFAVNRDFAQIIRHAARSVVLANASDGQLWPDQNPKVKYVHFSLNSDTNRPMTMTLPTIPDLATQLTTGVYPIHLFAYFPSVSRVKDIQFSFQAGKSTLDFKRGLSAKNVNATTATRRLGELRNSLGI